ncbi:MAG: hypothetical protein ACXADO_11515 [Candidatus Thorarchaeota archaeon]|jgi:hypothetical protein
MANEPIYLGVAGSQVELAYPDDRPQSGDARGRRMLEMYDGSLHYHSQGIKWGWSLSWSDLTQAEADEIQTEFERDSELSFVIGSTSYVIIVRPGSFSRRRIPGTSPASYDMRMELLQSD